MQAYWLENLRSDTLTSFFKIFPFFASDYFYIIIIAAAYWLYPRNRLSLDLGFLVPFSTLINCLLKNLFMAPRPPSYLHLIPVGDDFGLPSGDVQVAVVFWGILALKIHSPLLRFFGIMLVAFIMLSRVYLGVHSITDVIAALCFGLATVFIYTIPYVQKVTQEWFDGKSNIYWSVVLSTVLIFIATLSIHNLLPVPVALAAIGVLLGYGLSLRYLDKSAKVTNYLLVPAYLFILFLFYKIFPIIHAPLIFFWSSVILKYACLSWLIYIGLPLFSRKLFHRNAPF